MIASSLAASLLAVMAMQDGASPAITPSATSLPGPSGDPLALDMDSDPLLSVERDFDDDARFQALLAAAFDRSPAIDEAEARVDEAVAGKAVARAAQLPAGDVLYSTARTLARDFSNDLDNIIERSRRVQRTDAIATLQQPLFDFGAGAARTSAASARITAADARVDAVAGDVGLRAVSSWYDVFAFRALVGLGEAFSASQAKLGEAVEMRITQGVSARADRARVTSFMAAADSRLARYRRLLASAEARFGELFGQAPPANLRRAPFPTLPKLSREAAELRAASSPPVRAAEADANATKRDAKAAFSDIFPTITAGIDAGRYGVFETDNDYDIRARLTLRYRLFGGGDARAEQSAARARSDSARADRIREEARRDAAIAWADVNALEQQLAALRSSYIASRLSRDVVAERFRVARGSLFDLLDAEDSYFETAAAYLQGVTELDSARYVLLARMGGLGEAIKATPTTGSKR